MSVIEQESFRSVSLREAVTRSFIEVKRQQEKIEQFERAGREPMLVEVLAEEVSRAVATGGLRQRPSSAGLDAMYEISELCRQASGVAPAGVYMPLVLCRTLTTSGTGLTSLASTNGAKHGSSILSGLFPESAVLSSATVIGGLQGGNFEYLAEATAVDASDNWVAEVGSQSNDEPGFVALSMTPQTLRFHVDVSRRALMQRKIDLEVALRQLIVRRTMQGIDKSAYVGAGGNAPTGLLNNAGVTVLAAGTNGAAPSWDHVTELEYSVGTRMGSMTAPHFVTSPYLLKKLRKTAKGAGLDFIMGSDSNTLLERPMTVTTHSPDNLTKGTSSGVCSSLLYGDLAELIVGFWGPLAVDVTVDPFTRADQGTVRIHFRADVAVVPRNAGAFAVYKDLLGA